eukprot:gene12360-biopygen9855
MARRRSSFLFQSQELDSCWRSITTTLHLRVLDSTVVTELIVVKYKSTKPACKTPLKSITTERPMQIVAMDFVGPLPKSDQGHLYALVMTDHFTRWLNVYPTENLELARYTFFNAVKVYVSKKPSVWDEYLDAVTFAYRTTPHSVTQHTPADVF